MLGVAFSDKGFYQVHFLGKRIKFYASYWALGFLCSSVNMCCFCVMLSLVHVLCDVCIKETLNSPGSEGDCAHLCYLDKIAGERSTLVLVFRSGTKENFNGKFLKDVNDVLSWNWSGIN